MGEEKNATWWKDLLLLSDKTLAVKTDPINPLSHLTAAKYLDVIERDSGALMKNARWCVWSQESLDKCDAFSKSAFSR